MLEETKTASENPLYGIGSNGISDALRCVEKTPYPDAVPVALCMTSRISSKSAGGEGPRPDIEANYGAGGGGPGDAGGCGGGGGSGGGGCEGGDGGGGCGGGGGDSGVGGCDGGGGGCGGGD
ncbi:uncharacterized protein LOC103491744 [Cucumis melo]|uniref:Uncharacterized protein LOC103491744 n=1 Tax=Cucumis melo TaxID=3656 RepID=A0ABM3L587_CUCME|nr:uncharacterized protein LOC103491744 [Cucumis melo]